MRSSKMTQLVLMPVFYDRFMTCVINLVREKNCYKAMGICFFKENEDRCFFYNYDIQNILVLTLKFFIVL